ncbi:MAG: prepilin-type N-terminal cleavage/methylation domain-containing protein [Desulfobacterales bacterium]
MQHHTDERNRETNGKTPSRPGFTLLEVMVALSIISIVVTAVFGLQSQTVVLNTYAQFDTKAPFLAQFKIAEIIADIANHSEDQTGDFGDEFSGYAWRSSVKDIESETIGSFAEKMKRIDVGVTLNEGEFVYTLTTYRFIQE